MDLITKYFPHLTEEQRSQFAELDPLYREWNAKINVISRKDIDALYEHHVLHSLGIARRSLTSALGVVSLVSLWLYSSLSVSFCLWIVLARRLRSQGQWRRVLG